MRRIEATAWVVSVCAVSLRLSQAKTLGILVAAAMRVQRISLANIGRAMDGLTKHRIKRCWSLRDTRITKPERIDRLLLILAIAYLLLCGVGLIAKTQFTPAAWCSTQRDNECSIYTIGMIMLDKIEASPPAAFHAVLKLSEMASPNWG